MRALALAMLISLDLVGLAVQAQLHSLAKFCQDD